MRQAESGTAVADVCRQLGVSEATFYVGKKKFAHLGVSELRRMRQIEEDLLQNFNVVTWACTPPHLETVAVDPQRRGVEHKEDIKPAPLDPLMIIGWVEAVGEGLVVGGEIVGEAFAGRVAESADALTPSTLVRVIPNGIPATTLGAPGAADVL